MKDLLSFQIQTEDVFAASLYSNQHQESWQLLLMNRDDTRKNGRYAGLLTNQNKEVYEVLPVRKLANTNTIGNDIIGYDFLLNGKTLAAVEVINKGRIWIDLRSTPIGSW